MGASGRATTPASLGGLEESLGYAIRRAQIYAYQRFATVMSASGVRPAQYALLVLLGQNPGIMQSVAGEALNIEKGNLTVLLAELGKLGLTERRSLPTDRRVYQLHLTRKGKAKVGRLMEQHKLYEQVLSGSLSTTERMDLLSLLNKLIG